MYYFDYQTASFPTEGVIDAMKPFIEKRFGSLLAPHDFGQSLSEDIERAKGHLRTLINAGEDDQILATASGAEAICRVITGVYQNESRLLGKNHYLVGQNEGASSILSIENLDEFNCVHELVPLGKRGFVEIDQVTERIGPRTALLSLSMVSGITGLIQPLDEICRLCRKEGVLVHIDVTHALVSQKVDVQKLDVDFLTFHGEQIHGPKGVGALFIRRGLSLPPLIVTGQINSCFSLINPGAIIGLGQAALETLNRLNQINTQVALMRFHFEKFMKSKAKNIEIQLNDLDRAPNHSVITFSGVHSEAMAYRLNRKGIFATFGGGLFQQIHFLLQAIGIDSIKAQSSLGFTFSHLTTRSCIDEGAALVVETHKELVQLQGEAL